jgi:hypothetical protein
MPALGPVELSVIAVALATYFFPPTCRFAVARNRPQRLY